MSTKKCPACGTKAPTDAVFCPECNRPFPKIGKNNYVTMAFDSVQIPLFRTICSVFDSNGNTLSSCRPGAALTFPCEKTMTVKIEMYGCFGRPTFSVNPGDEFQVSLRGINDVVIKKEAECFLPEKN